MVVNVKKYKYAYRRRYERKDGTVRYTTSYVIHPYQCKLHHPDSAEIKQIQLELSLGIPAYKISEMHNLGKDTRRLRRLLNKWEKDHPPKFTDKDLHVLLKAFYG